MTSPASAPATALISVSPDELRFLFELDKQTYCDLKVLNNTEHYVAFKVKTTSPKKYFVRPNTGVIQPWDSCIIRVTLQAQREFPPDMQCKDKFLLQRSTRGNSEDGALKNAQSVDSSSGQALQQLKEERDAAARQTRQLQQELDMLKRRRNQRGDAGFSFTFAIFVGLIGALLGFLLKLLFSSPSTE